MAYLGTLVGVILPISQVITLFSSIPPTYKLNAYYSIYTHDLPYQDFTITYNKTYEIYTHDLPYSQRTFKRAVMHFNVDTSLYDQISGNNTLSMQVKVESNPTENIRVALYYRDSNKLVDVKISDAHGYVTFTGLSKMGNEYYAVSITDLDYNALVYDKLIAE